MKEFNFLYLPRDYSKDGQGYYVFRSLRLKIKDEDVFNNFIYDKDNNVTIVLIKSNDEKVDIIFLIPFDIKENVNLYVKQVVEALDLYFNYNKFDVINFSYLPF